MITINFRLLCGNIINTMDEDYKFYIISGRVTDSNAKPVEYVTVTLKNADCRHETEIIASCRTNSKGEFYFEESLKIGLKLRLDIDEPGNGFRPDYRDFEVGTRDEYHINFML